MILTEKVFLVHKEKVQISVNKIFVGVSPNLYIKTQRILSSHVTTAILFHQL